GIAIEQLPNQPYFNQVTVHAYMDLLSAARLANMSSDEFAALNAAFPRKLIRSDSPVNLLVPVDKSDKFQRNLETGNWDTWQPYAAQKGERATEIAKRFDVSLDRLEEHNQLHLKKGKLVRMQTILVPVKNRGVVAAPNVQPAPTRHEVQRGDTFFSIARRYGLSVAELAQANPDFDDGLKAGQVIRLPLNDLSVRKHDVIRTASFKAGKPMPEQPRRYTIRRGDTLSTIAERFEARLADLKAWNPAFRKNSTIRAGQTIVVRKP
ncbi:MAG: LysM peptidoglycan-binding domain-containing protein, partial [Thiobacillus sp.]|nr:LysM peptidoglycan-binding domain-containing protein [Thiobacillus sp.]